MKYSKFLFLIRSQTGVMNNCILHFCLKSTRITHFCWQTHCVKMTDGFGYFHLYRTCFSQQSMSHFWHNFILEIRWQPSRVVWYIYVVRTDGWKSMSLPIKFGMDFWMLSPLYKVLQHNRISGVRRSSWTHFKWFSIDARCHRIHHNWFVHVA